MTTKLCRKQKIPNQSEWSLARAWAQMMTLLGLVVCVQVQSMETTNNLPAFLEKVLESKFGVE